MGAEEAGGAVANRDEAVAGVLGAGGAGGAGGAVGAEDARQAVTVLAPAEAAAEAAVVWGGVGEIFERRGAQQQC